MVWADVHEDHQAISRWQELAPDALAARVVGAAHLIDGLKAIHGGGLAFGAYWRNEYMPAVASGFMPPLAHGFATFMQCDDLSSKVDDAVERELEMTGEAQTKSRSRPPLTSPPNGLASRSPPRCSNVTGRFGPLWASRSSSTKTTTSSFSFATSMQSPTASSPPVIGVPSSKRWASTACGSRPRKPRPDASTRDKNGRETVRNPMVGHDG